MRKGFHAAVQVQLDRGCDARWIILYRRKCAGCTCKRRTRRTHDEVVQVPLYQVLIIVRHLPIQCGGGYDHKFFKLRWSVGSNLSFHHFQHSPTSSGGSVDPERMFLSSDLIKSRFAPSSLAFRNSCVDIVNNKPDSAGDMLVYRLELAMLQTSELEYHLPLRKCFAPFAVSRRVQKCRPG